MQSKNLKLALLVLPQKGLGSHPKWSFPLAGSPCGVPLLQKASEIIVKDKLKEKNSISAHTHTCRPIAGMLQTTQVVQTCLEFTKRAGLKAHTKTSGKDKKGRAFSQFPTQLRSVTATRGGRLSESFQIYCLFCLKEFYSVQAQERPCHQQAFFTMKRTGWPYCKTEHIVLASVLLPNTHEEGEMCPKDLFSIWTQGPMSRGCGQGPCHDTEQGTSTRDLSCLVHA